MQYILVVEDDYDLNQAICYSLKKSGYGVYGVTFMEKGKQTFIENQIDLILLDVNLPDGEGFSFCQWVKKQREVPVIYLTASACTGMTIRLSMRTGPGRACWRRTWRLRRSL